ncbi:SDR family oxidoreductase [Caldanaerobius polysaccharolyticus]|uniref:SDR family oxidoreductase n=1 Tax=Caldanaerobius polysaccharolyticus TaxID=44256 RepID=UPI0004796992|nr:SDR family oxidoreductase [Caldanaerobius polysaccharolyticus]
MKVLVTGGAGFIGSNLVDLLIERGCDVVVLDSLITGKEENVHKAARFYRADVRDRSIEEVFEREKPDYVIHHAAQIRVQKSIEDPLYDASVNILGTVNLLQQCVRYGVKKFIYASSAAVYGNPLYLGIDESHRVQPLSFYGVAKHTVEHYLYVYKELYGLNYTVLRYANVYGPRQDYTGEGGVVAVFIDRLLHGKKPIIYGDGEQTRDFIYVKDVAEANYRALKAGDGEILNISTNKCVTINYLFSLLKELTMSNQEPQYQPPRKGDIMNSYLDNKRAKEVLSWQPRYRLEQGLKETVEYYNNIFTVR